MSSVLCFSIVAGTGIFHPCCIHVLPAMHVFPSWLLHVNVATLGRSYCSQPSDLPQKAIGGVTGQVHVWLECIEKVMLSLSRSELFWSLTVPDGSYRLPILFVVIVQGVWIIQSYGLTSG